ncbi:CBM_HP2_G0028250.mRNA.1.CDS.1 [Saccharomyces cerevisiae]|nr:CBM_HP2_G0028250.mRNA.1.CDS.1 [Saccharomyces cerevisiae]CAI6649040.1 CBM_HP2_G0028250.mRNA.1.CDS.1 [Saccharomyces cerevisiae]
MHRKWRNSVPKKSLWLLTGEKHSAQFSAPARLIDPLPISDWNTSLFILPQRTKRILESANNHFNSICSSIDVTTPSSPQMDEVIPQDSNPAN